jgi:hypothetical protein
VLPGAFARGSAEGSLVDACTLGWCASGIKGSHKRWLWRSAPTPYIWEMVTPTCEKCGRRNLVIFHVEPEEAWRAVVRDRWKSICPSCFDAEAELTRVRYQFIGTRAVSWSDSAAPAKQPGKKRR